MARTFIIAALLAGLPIPASADDTKPRVSASVGAGVATPFHGDFDFKAGAWLAAVRVATSRYMVIEGFLGEWRHTSERVSTNQIVRDPDGVIGRIDRATQRTQHVRPGVGFNVLAGGSSGRVSFSAGGGAGLLLYRRRFTQTFEGCVVTGAPCTDSTIRFSSGGFSVQGTAGIDVAIAPRLAAFGEYRIAVPVEDPGFGEGTVIGGVRVTIW
jgi:hypothetical protein